MQSTHGKFLIAAALFLFLTLFLPDRSCARFYQEIEGIQTMNILATDQQLSEINNQELKEIRGCNDTYYFGLDIGINLTQKNPSINVTFNANVPDNAPSFSGNTVSFNDGNVSFQAGMGNSALGNGFYQVISVAGNQNIVIANTNININMPTPTGITLPAALSSLRVPGIFGGVR